MNRNHEVYKHKHICLVGDHYNPLAIIRSLGEEGIKPIVLLCSEHPHLIQYSKYIGKIHFFKTNEEGFSYLLAHYANETLKPFIYTGSDDIALLIDKNYDRLKEHFYFANAKGNLEKYQNKFEITSLAKECGVGIPNEEMLPVGTFPTTLKYPVFTKAITSAGGGIWKDQAFICKDRVELKDAYNKIRAKNILVQEYIEKKNELCIDGISINGGEQIFMPYGCEYYRFIPGNYGNYMKFTPFTDEDLTERIKNIIKGAQYTGIFCIEFMVGKDDKLYFLEVNFRHSGWGYAFTYGGFNLPFRWAVSIIDNLIYLDNFFPLEKFNVMSEIADFNDCMSYHRTGFWKWFSDFYKCDCKLIYNKKDNKPFRKAFVRIVNGIIKQKTRKILHIK